MTTVMEWTEAGSALAETLEAENSALTSLDLPKVGAMLARKQRALADLAAAKANKTSHDAADRMARRLQALALENKRLLERAITAQGRVIEVVARAAAAAEPPRGYGNERSGRPTAFALSAKA
jgi:flagellar biosynthesis/type III secretory pathway chaperone